MRTVISPTAAIRHSLFILIIAGGLLTTLPSLAFAQTYGGSSYGGGDYNVGTLPAAAAASSNGGGVVIGGPNGIGYVNTNPTATTTFVVSTTQSTKFPEDQIRSILSLLSSFGVDQTTISNVEATLRGSSVVTPAPSAAGTTFTRDLEIGVSGDDVLALQKYLNAHGFPLAASGPGSPGNETLKFGAATKAALIKFQAAKGITPAAGYFGPKTRAIIGQ